jgi:uridylate kinase
MDGAAFAVARDTGIPILVFCGEGEGAIERALSGLAPSTLVSGGE